jgi:hypothetical protein
MTESIRTWWSELAEEDAAGAILKREEYGSADLPEIGRAVLGWRGEALSPARAAAQGSFFYLLGKVARLQQQLAAWDGSSAYPGLEDTLRDLTVYSMMIRRIVQTGAW